MASVSMDFVLILQKTVADNASIPLMFDKHIKLKDIGAKVAGILSRVGLEGFQDKMADGVIE